MRAWYMVCVATGTYYTASCPYICIDSIRPCIVLGLLEKTRWLSAVLVVTHFIFLRWHLDGLTNSDFFVRDTCMIH